MAAYLVAAHHLGRHNPALQEGGAAIRTEHHNIYRRVGTLHAGFTATTILINGYLYGIK